MATKKKVVAKARAVKKPATKKKTAVKDEVEHNHWEDFGSEGSTIESEDGESVSCAERDDLD